MKRAFFSIKITGTIRDKKMPILLISNHVSWWDGFWALYVNKKLFGRKFYFMMLEEQIRKHWFFKYAGGFSVKKNSRSIIDSLNYASELLFDNKNLILIFPQGKINSLYQPSIEFEKGIDRILSKSPNVQVFFMAGMVDYHSNSKPTVHLYIKEYAEKLKIDSLEKHYNEFYNSCIEQQIES